MDPQQQFCLKWNSFGNNLVTTFETLFKSESLTDVTLFCEGVTFKAHKIILAACSKHFQDLFEAAPFSPHILLILDGTSSSNMSALLEFMYKGEVHVSQESLSGFLKAAESLQIKGLSMEQEQRLVSGGARVSDLRVGGKTPTGMPSSLKLVGEGDTSEGMHPPSSTGYSSILSPYLSHYRGGSVPGAPSTSPYDHPPPRKRHHRSPSDSNQRASVLRVGVPERESPLPLTYSPHLSPHEFNFHRSTGEREVEHHDSSNSSSTLPFAPQTQAQEPVAVESTPPASAARTSPEWRASSQEPPSNSCPEDLRIKTEPRSSNSSSGTGNHNSTTSSEHNHRPSDSSSVNSSRADTNHHEINHMGDESWREQTNGKQGGQTGGGGEHVGAGGERGGTVWNSTTGTGYQTSAEISNAHKSAIATTTPTGKKLQCPYCERLYGYETNLRAHIRQRHQGIRAPCPYCSRTFTRNNTVRRHIAREHKTELNLTAKAFQLSQVQNHNQ